MRPWVRIAPAVLLIAWGGNHFTPLLHFYEEHGDYAPWQVNFLLGTYVFGLVPGMMAAAAISDRRGRRPVLLGGVAISALGSIVVGVGEQSFALLGIGRALSGMAVGIAMAVGGSWMKELSSPPFEQDTPAGAGARRPALTLTLGFGLGAAVTGILAQWGPAPTHTPYVLHLVLTAGTTLLLLTAPEGRPESLPVAGRWWHDLRVPAARDRTFRRLVIPAAPWVFAAAGVAYAIMPSVAAPQLGERTTIFATVLTVLTLGAGTLVQPFVARIDARTRGRSLSIGLILMTTGMALAALAVGLGSPSLIVGVALVLGVAYGITVVSGLALVQRIATPSQLAGLTGVFYALTYIGFLLPAALAAMLPLATYTVSLTVVALLCATCLGAVIRGRRREGSLSIPSPRSTASAEAIVPR